MKLIIYKIMSHFFILIVIPEVKIFDTTKHTCIENDRMMSSTYAQFSEHFLFPDTHTQVCVSGLGNITFSKYFACILKWSLIKKLTYNNPENPNCNFTELPIELFNCRSTCTYHEVRNVSFFGTRNNKRRY